MPSGSGGEVPERLCLLDSGWELAGGSAFHFSHSPIAAYSDGIKHSLAKAAPPKQWERLIKATSSP